MVGAHSPAKVGAPGTGFHGCRTGKRRRNQVRGDKTHEGYGREIGWAVVTGAIAHTHPGEWLANLSLGHVSEEARVPGVGSDKPDEAHVGTRGGLEPQNRVL